MNRNFGLYAKDFEDVLLGDFVPFWTKFSPDYEYGGFLCGFMRDGELLVFASADILMRCDIEEMQAWELLSKDGVVITAPDKEHGGIERTIIVYYVYYR